jgi:hypothetical protein
MRKKMAVVAVGCLGVVLFSGAPLAHSQSDAPLADVLYVQAGAPAGVVESEPPAIVEFGPPDIVGFKMRRGDSVVKDAPFSAQTVLETTQVLADGTHIDRKTMGMVYRDSQGRMRREETLPGFGPFAAAGKARQAVLIHDPVAGVHYLLEPDPKIARKMAIPAPGTASSDAMPARLPHGSTNETTESLGTQAIEGVSAAGTRITRTIPVGQIGNDKPLQIVIERWYSADLQMNVLTKRSDPRMGTTTYQLTNISREEPAPSLFEVPSDYTVKEGGPKLR